MNVIGTGMQEDILPAVPAESEERVLFAQRTYRPGFGGHDPCFGELTHRKEGHSTQLNGTKNGAECAHLGFTGPLCTQGGQKIGFYLEWKTGKRPTGGRMNAFKEERRRREQPVLLEVRGDQKQRAAGIHPRLGKTDTLDL